MIVCIAEKPSVATDIAKVLGARTRKDGYIEGNGYQVTWTYGHLCNLKAPHEYKKEWKKWSMDTLPMIPEKFETTLIDSSSIKKQFKIIKTLFSKADKIINCGDAGQEGELIQRWVMEQARVKCPVERLWISSLTEEAITEGFKKLKPQREYDNLYKAGLSRSCGDWLLGMNATRLYTIKYGNHKGVLSIGRVQTPTLALIVNRQREIDNFVVQPYWQLTTSYRGVKFLSTVGDIKTKEDKAKAEHLMDEIKARPFVVNDIQEKPSKQNPPQLYDLTSLQVDCNRRHSMTAEQTLKTLQSLYEMKLTTYPRVDTRYLSDDIYPKCEGIIKSLAKTQVGAPAQALVGQTLAKSKKVFDTSKVTDHHAIIPTGLSPVEVLKDGKVLSKYQENVYKLIVLRFISVFYPDCIFSTTTVVGSVADMKFKAKGKTIIESGWRAVYGTEDQEPTDDKEEKEENTVLPAFEVGESGSHEMSLVEKNTTPPKPYTEATLLRAMETAGKFVEDETLRDALKENGIGRPSSRASIIETLFKREYIVRQKRNIVPTQTGISLIDQIRQPLLKSCELTGIWEKRLRDIEHGKYSLEEFIEGMKSLINEIIND